MSTSQPKPSNDKSRTFLSLEELEREFFPRSSRKRDEAFRLFDADRLLEQALPLAENSEPAR